MEASLREDLSRPAVTPWLWKGWCLAILLHEASFTLDAGEHTFQQVWLGCFLGDTTDSPVLSPRSQPAEGVLLSLALPGVYREREGAFPLAQWAVGRLWGYVPDPLATEAAGKL